MSDRKTFALFVAVFLGLWFLPVESPRLQGAIHEALQRARVDSRDVKKVLIHQANGKMDEAILAATYELYGIPDPPHDVMPMTISWLGNSSVATVPTLLDRMPKRAAKKAGLAIPRTSGSEVEVACLPSTFRCARVRQAHLDHTS